MEPQSFRKGDDPGIEYLNPPVADGINNPPESQVRSFFVNFGVVGLGLLGVFLAVGLAANYLTPLIPFRWERAAAGGGFLQARLDARGEAKQRELRRIAEKVAGAMELPEGMEVEVFYNPGKVVNAFATFGGNIVFFQGLLDLMESEDGVALVLAHEIAHVRHRDAVKGVVRVFGLGLMFMGVDGGMDRVVDMGMAGYSRGQEEAADLAAAGVLGRVYGHVGGAREFFGVMARKVEGRSGDEDVSRVPVLTASHPDTLLRLRMVEEEAGRLGVPVGGVMTPLPDVLDDSRVYFG